MHLSVQELSIIAGDSRLTDALLFGIIVRMFESGPARPVDVALQQVVAASQELTGIDPAALSGDELLDLLDRLEADARRRTAVAGRLIAELHARGIAGELGYSSTAVLLSERLRVGRREAAGRVRLAADLAPRRAMSGEQLESRFPLVASALAHGEISVRHATIICATVDRLPDRVATDQPDLAAQVEPTLLEHAQTLDPEQLAVLARRVTACLDPDGVLATDHDQARHRDATLVTLPDGSGRLTATLTSQAAAVWATVLDTLSRPVPTETEPDRRTPGQRRHDALTDAGRRLLRSGDLPDAGGTPATVLITLTLDQLETRLGLATTAHGGTLTIPAALQLAADAHLVPAVLDARGAVLHLGRTRRLASPAQRLALAARDRGCSFPACDRPPDWCETHHVNPWADGGTTDLDNTTLLCGFHHREHTKRGWTVRITHGLPEWTPPRWIDPQQIPRRNNTHHVPHRFPPPTPRTAPQHSAWTSDSPPLAHAS
jgi:Domain of unknown function (DUF222)/HNH endonuclease